MQHNGPVVRGDDLDDGKWLAKGGIDTLSRLGKKCSDMDKNKGKIPPPPRRSTNGSSFRLGVDSKCSIPEFPLDPYTVKFHPVDGNGNPVLSAATTVTRTVSASRRGPVDTNTQSGGGAAANTSSAVTQSGAGK